MCNWYTAILITFIISMLACQVEANESKVIKAANSVIVTHYDILMIPDFQDNSMFNRVKCFVRNTGITPTDNLVFSILAGYGGSPASLGVEFEVRDVFQIAGISTLPVVFHRGESKDGVTQTALQDEISSPLVSIHLAKPLMPGDETVLVFTYHWRCLNSTKLNDGWILFATFHNGEKQVSLTPDYNFLPNTEFSPDALPKATWTLTACVPDGYTCAALDGSFKGSHRRDDKIIYKWESAIPTMCNISMGCFDTITIKKHGVPVIFYLPPGTYNKQAIDGLADLLAKSYRFYSDLYGTLEGDAIQVGMDTARGDGGKGGYRMILFYRDAECMQKMDTGKYNINIWVVTHELAHSWWGGSVTAHGQGMGFLQESLASFSADYLGDNLFHSNTSREMLALLFYQGDYKRSLFVGDAEDIGACAFKGPHILNTLLAEMGREAFFKALKSYSSSHSHGKAKLSDFITACNKASGQDYSEWLDQWLHNSACPDYRLVSFTSHQMGNDWQTVVTILNSGKGIITCPIELHMGSITERTSVRVPAGLTSSASYSTPEEVRNIVIDPENKVFQGHSANWAQRYMNIDDCQMDITWYIKGLAFAQIGENRRAIDCFSHAIANNARAPFLYSRGISHLHNGDDKEAVSDLSGFIDKFLQEPDQSMANMNFFRIVSGGRDQWYKQICIIFYHLTGLKTSYDPTSTEPDQWVKVVNQWQDWWAANKKTFKLSETAHDLTPSGVQK